MLKYYLSVDIEECKVSHNCDVNANCTDRDGTYSCDCNSGYSGDGFNCSGKNSQFIVPCL